MRELANLPHGWTVAWMKLTMFCWILCLLLFACTIWTKYSPINVNLSNETSICLLLWFNYTACAFEILAILWEEPQNVALRYLMFRDLARLYKSIQRASMLGVVSCDKFPLDIMNSVKMPSSAVNIMTSPLSKCQSSLFPPCTRILAVRKGQTFLVKHTHVCSSQEPFWGADHKINSPSHLQFAPPACTGTGNMLITRQVPAKKEKKNLAQYLDVESMCVHVPTAYYIFYFISSRPHTDFHWMPVIQ